MNKINNRRNLIIVLLLLISIGFAYLSTTLNIAGSSIVHGNKWQVIWDDTSVDVISGSVTADTPTVDNNKTTVSYDITLNSPGDYYEFSVDAFNNGTIDAMVDTISFAYKENNSNVTLPSCIKHTVKYADGIDISSKDLLPAGQKQKYYINIEYDRNVTTSNMISTNRTFTVTIKVTYEQADTTAVAKVINNNTLCLSNKHQEITSNIVCKRASNLHTEECNRDDGRYCSADGYNLGEIIIYGNCGTTGTLTPGDAFDCDVDGNGKYEEETERFYYVAPKDGETNSTDAVLLYYKNLTGSIRYNANGSNLEGPLTAITKLPSWTNTNLNYIGTRQIKNELGSTSQHGDNVLSQVVYNNRTRLITYQEMVYAYGTTTLENNEYLFEETAYADGAIGAWWLETPTSDSNNNAYKVTISSKNIGRSKVDNAYYLRPAIEVPLKNISY